MSEKNKYKKEQKIATGLALLSLLLFYLGIWIDGYHLKFLFSAIITLIIASLVQSAIIDAEKKDKEDKNKTTNKDKYSFKSVPLKSKNKKFIKREKKTKD